MNASDTLLGVRLQEHIDAVSNDTFRKNISTDKDRINTLATTKILSVPSEAPIQTSPPSSTKISDCIDEALSLDLRLYPRPNRHDVNKVIPIKTTTISSQCTKLIILITAEKWGLNDKTLTFKERMRIARSASRLVAYDNGYVSEFSISSILRWDKEVINKVKDGVSTRNINANAPHVPVKYVDVIENNYPGYLHTLFRKAIKLKGPKASFTQLALAMNEISNTVSELRPALTLHRLQLNRWFCSQGGKEISGLEKPLDSDKHKELRKEWVVK